MISNARQFDDEIERVLTLPEEIIYPLRRRADIEVDRKWVLRTPVDTGFTRGQKTVSYGSPSDELTNRVDKSGSSTINANRAVIDANRDPYTISFHQNVAKAFPILDEGRFVPPNPGPSKDPRKGRKGRVLVKDAHSVQAPRGIVGITFDEVEAKYRRIAEQISREVL